MGFLAGFIQAILISYPTYKDEEWSYSFNFTNYFKSFYSLFIFFTGNNSPQVLLSLYPAGKYISTVLFILIYMNNIVLTGLVIGLSYYKMKLVMAENIEKVMSHPIKKAVFELLLEYPTAPRKYIKKLISMYIAGRIQPYFSMTQMIEEQYLKNIQPTKASEFIFGILRRTKSYELFYSIIDIAIVTLALYVIQIKKFEKCQHYLYMILLCTVSSLDFVHHSLFDVVGNFDRTWKTVISFCLNIFIMVMSIVLLIDDQRTILLIKIWGFGCIMKLFRFAVFYFRFDRKKLKHHILYPFLQYTGDLAGQLTVIYVIFGMIGLNVFGGLINDYTMTMYNKTMETDYDYVDINFNTFLNSLVSFYVLSLNDNWPIIANLAIVNAETNRRIMKLTFLAFKFIVNYILINSLIAFIIEIFQAYEKAAVYIDPSLQVTTLGVRKPTYDELSQIFKEELYNNLDKSYK